MRPIKILIVDDYAVVRNGLRALIETTSDMQVIGEAGDAEVAVTLARKQKPDVILLDVAPLPEGLSLLQALSANQPRARILILTNFGEEDMVIAALRAGAHGYLLKEAVLTDVLTAIHDVHSGRLVLHPSFTPLLTRAIIAMSPLTEPEGDTPLTVRELNVLRLVARGLADATIAELLDTEERVVRQHLTRILHKLHLENRTQAALYALRNNLAALD